MSVANIRTSSATRPSARAPGVAPFLVMQMTQEAAAYAAALPADKPRLL